ncbi:MAG: ATP-dependent DNA helicase RecG, partial [Spirochaetota bacterium]|nr:ATP-dependent DNA helicase RecG [Spirochaetota bacterium]
GYDFLYARGKRVLKIVISDGFMRASLICFNRDFLKTAMEEEKDYIVFGDFQYKYGELQASKFEFTPKGSASDSLNFMRLVPIYSLTEGITQNFMRQVVYQALISTKFEESLPASLINKYNFISKKEAFNEIHFPTSFDSLQKAIFRLKYYELFELEANVALKKFYFSHQKKKKTYNETESQNHLINQFINTLPFSLTEGQKNAIKEIKVDIHSHNPMHRMLQGDVGSGKTLVAAISMLIAVEAGFQAALMVPTEILAKQHFNTLNNYFKPLSIQVNLLTGGMKQSERKEIINNIQNGIAQIIIGTHALFSEDVIYNDLSLIVIDEQHKFGVQERIKLVEKGDGVDILVMTATPIPRTLALTAYGDLEISIIPDKPRSSVHIHSRCIYNEEKRKAMYIFIDKEIEKGRQGFVVCPLIDESEKLSISSATYIYDEIKNELLPHRRIAILHGKQSIEDKEIIMSTFLNGDYDIIVSTTVIEVGVDIPNASFMIVENADRFGLSQLHQLRGRVGRGNHHSFCFFIVPNNITEDGKSRIKALLTHTDGFKLAEEDLKIRGPGEFLGIKQSGIDSLKLANLIEDENILLKAKEDAFNIVKLDPQFKNKENYILSKTIYKKFLEKHKSYLTN